MFGCLFEPWLITDDGKNSYCLKIEALWDSELWKPQIPQFLLSFPLSLLHVTPPPALGLPYHTPLHINTGPLRIFVRSLIPIVYLYLSLV
jgi:hypothetical protein